MESECPFRLSHFCSLCHSRKKNTECREQERKTVERKTRKGKSTLNITLFRKLRTICALNLGNCNISRRHQRQTLVAVILENLMSGRDVKIFAALLNLLRTSRDAICMVTISDR